jgi:antitoxin (DNA-binding transcriptional repressor) of toxin-antitoxin stability system
LRDPALALSMAGPLLTATRIELARVFAVFSAVHSPADGEEQRLKEQYRSLGQRPLHLYRLCTPAQLRTDDDAVRVCKEVCIDRFAKGCIVEAQHNYRSLIADSPTRQRENAAEPAPPTENASQPESTLVVLQVKEFRTKLKAVLDGVERGGRCLIRAKGKALAIIRPKRPTDHSEVRITRREFTRNTSGYLGRARYGEPIAIRRAVPRADVPDVLLQRPSPEMMRAPTAEERRVAERDRKRAARDHDRRLDREKLAEWLAKLRTVDGMTPEQVLEARKLWEQRAKTPPK